MKKCKILSVLAVLAMSMQVQAQYDDRQQSTTYPDTRVYTRSEMQPHVGLMAGTITTENSDIDDNEAEYGIEIGYQPVPALGLALEASKATDLTPPPKLAQKTTEDDRTTILAKASYMFGGSTVARFGHIGVAAGTVLRGDNSEFAGGPTLGFDIPLARELRESRVSLGADAKYLFTDGDEPETVSVAGNLKYWF